MHSIAIYFAIPLRILYFTNPQEIIESQPAERYDHLKQFVVSQRQVMGFTSPVEPTETAGKLLFPYSHSFSHTHFI